MIYKHITGGMYDSDTRCLNTCLLTQYYITDKITFYVYVKKNHNWLNKYILSLSLSLSLFKSGPAMERNNYRPISILPIL